MTKVSQFKKLILIKDKVTKEYVDKTSEISSYEKTRTGYILLYKFNAKLHNFQSWIRGTKLRKIWLNHGDSLNSMGIKIKIDVPPFCNLVNR